MDIRKRIKEKGFTLGDVAAKMKNPKGELGLPQASLSQIIINGNPTYQKLKEIADIIGISVAELVREEDEHVGCGTEIVCPNCGSHLHINISISE